MTFFHKIIKPKNPQNLYFLLPYIHTAALESFTNVWKTFLKFVMAKDQLNFLQSHQQKLNVHKIFLKRLIF